MAYDNRFKKKAIEYYYEHGNVRKTAKIFGISTNTFNEWHKEYKEHGEFLIKPKPANNTKLNEQDLQEYIDNHPDDYQEEIAKHFGVTQQGISKALKRFKITRKKRRSGIKSKTLQR
jgi:transposase